MIFIKYEFDGNIYDYQQIASSIGFWNIPYLCRYAEVNPDERGCTDCEARYPPDGLCHCLLPFEANVINNFGDTQ